MDKNDLQYDLLKAELLLVQGQIDKYDGNMNKINGFAVTLWLAIVGWGIQSTNEYFCLLAIVVVIAFWFYESMEKVYRQDYKDRRDVIEKELNHLFMTNEGAQGFKVPSLPLHSLKKIWSTMFVAHIFIPYILFVLLSAVLYFIIH